MSAFKAPVGTHDVLPPESERWARLVAGFAAHVGRAGYGLLQRPIFEEIGVFRPVGEGTDVVSKEMYDFLDKLFNIALPRVRDFSGVSPRSFDGHGNFTLGLREQLIFPEIDYDAIDKIRGMEVVIVTSAPTDEEGRRLLQLMGMPFKRG